MTRCPSCGELVNGKPVEVGGITMVRLPLHGAPGRPSGIDCRSAERNLYVLPPDDEAALRLAGVDAVGEATCPMCKLIVPWQVVCLRTRTHDGYVGQTVLAYPTVHGRPVCRAVNIIQAIVPGPG